MHRDDGVGSRIIDYILGNDLEHHFCALDFADNIWGILPRLNPETEKILIIDCAKMGEPAGNFRFFSLDAIHCQDNLTVESHESSIVQLINMASKADYFIPDITIMGIEPETMAPGQELSEKIAEQLAYYVRQAIQFIDN